MMLTIIIQDTSRATLQVFFSVLSFVTDYNIIAWLHDAKGAVVISQGG